MDKRDLSVDQPRCDHVGRVENAAEYREDFVGGRVSPAADGFTGDVFGKIGHGAACGLQDDALLAHPFQRLHDHRFNYAFRAVHQTLHYCPINRQLASQLPPSEY